MKKQSEKIMALVLSVIMVICIAPITTLATEDTRVLTMYRDIGKFIAPIEKIIDPVVQGYIPISNKDELEKIGNDSDYPWAVFSRP